MVPQPPPPTPGFSPPTIDGTGLALRYPKSRTPAQASARETTSSKLKQRLRMLFRIEVRGAAGWQRRAKVYFAKQYNRPVPPLGLIFSTLQPAVGCTAAHGERPGFRLMRS